MRRLLPLRLTLLLAFLAALAGCETPPAPTFYPPLPEGTGTSVADRFVGFTDGTSLNFKAFRHQAFNPNTGRTIVLHIEPPALVNDPDAVAQLKLEPGPGSPYTLTSVSATYLAHGRYGTFPHPLVHNQPADEHGSVVVPLTAWDLSHLFPSDEGGNRININDGAFEAAYHYGRSRLFQAIATWQPVYDMLRDEPTRADTLIETLSGYPMPIPQRPPVEGETFGGWEVMRTNITAGDKLYRPFALVYSTTHADTGLELIVILEPYFLDPGRPRGRHDLQVRFAFLGEANPPHGIPFRLGFGSEHSVWRVEPIPETPNQFMALIPQGDVGRLFCQERTAPLMARSGAELVTYEVDTRGLSRALNGLDDSFFEVETTDLP